MHNPWMLERRRSTRERLLRVVASGGGCGQQRDRRSLPAAARGLRTRCSTYSGLHKFLVNHHTLAFDSDIHCDRWRRPTATEFGQRASIRE
jgi:hypothetical protein